MYLETAANLPPYLYSLAHYEWVELSVAVADVAIDAQQIDVESDLLDRQPVLAPALVLLSYDYPVHKISPRNKPAAPLPQAAHLLVFRNAEDDVRFIELNPVTARLLDILKAQTLTCRQALRQIALELAHPDPEAVILFGQEILAGLKQQEVVLGSRL
jgi:hypothetical protein